MATWFVYGPLEFSKKKWNCPRNMVLIKNHNFYPNFSETLLQPTHEQIILSKLHNNWIKIVDFLILILYFRASSLFLEHSLVLTYFYKQICENHNLKCSNESGFEKDTYFKCSKECGFFGFHIPPNNPRFLNMMMAIVG